MAATRVIVSASNTITTSLLQKRSLRSSKSFSLCFKNTQNRFVSLQKRRLFTCSAIYNPQVQIKEEGQPETLDYRVFFLDNSGKKVVVDAEFVDDWSSFYILFCFIWVSVGVMHYYVSLINFISRCFLALSFLFLLCG